MWSEGHEQACETPCGATPSRPAASAASRPDGLLITTIFTGYSDTVLGQTNVVGGYLPVFAVLLICFLSFLWNLIAGRLSSRLCLSQRELAVVFAIMLVAAPSRV